MSPENRKAATAAYKEKKPAWGVYAVICSATGDAFVGGSRHVDNHKNGLWFALRQGTARSPALQALWRKEGEANFRFEELERLRDDFPDVGRSDELKRRRAIWLDRLKALPL